MTTQSVPPPAPVSSSPSTPKKPHPLRGGMILTAGVTAALVIGVLIGSGNSKSNASSTAAPTAPAAVTVTETPTPAPAVTVTETPAPAPTVTVTEGPPPAEFKDGINLVGVDVQPGTYRSANPRCYFERLSDTSGTFDAVIANGNGATVITIDPTDKAFNSEDCAPWTRVN